MTFGESQTSRRTDNWSAFPRVCGSESYLLVVSLSRRTGVIFSADTGTLFLSSTKKTIPIGERFSTDVEPGEYSISDYAVSNKFTHLLRHAKLPREDDGAIECSTTGWTSCATVLKFPIEPNPNPDHDRTGQPVVGRDTNHEPRVSQTRSSHESTNFNVGDETNHDRTV